MRTRNLTTLSVAMFCSGIGAWGFAGRAYSHPEFMELVGEDALLRAGTGAPETTKEPLAVGGSVVVDVGALVDRLDELTVDERPQQIADWALYGTVLQHGGDAETITNALFDRSPMRDPALVDVINYDYNPGRRVYVGDDQVWLFFSAFDTHPEVTLGRLADTVRMERGEKPMVFQIYRFRGEIAGRGEIVVERLPDVGSDAMFSSEYGYREDVVSDVAHLGRWLDSVDDLSYVAVEGNLVRVGGRRFEAARTRGVDLDDLAVLYQAHLKGERDPGFSLDPQADPAKLIHELETLLASPVQLIDAAKARVGETVSQNVDPSAVPIDLGAARLVVDSIDPERSFADYRVPPGASEQITEVIDALRKLPTHGDEQAASAILNQLGSVLTSGAVWDDDVLAADLVRYIRHRGIVQCARYDGPVQGTRAAMTMFYTDVMMKVWQSVDYHESAPDSAVPGFVNAPDVTSRLEPEYVDELDRLPGTRIWLGLREDGYTQSSLKALSFAPIVTRLYAAGSNPLRIDEESEQVNEPSRRTIGWWHRHYADVADYEQEYHRQNQLMKWSIATASLVEAGVLRALGERTAARDQVFETWYRRHESLKFKEDIRLLPRAQWVGGTECMERLISRQYEVPGGLGTRWMEGGVSLGGKGALKSTRSVGGVDDVARGLSRGADLSRATGQGVTSAQRGLYRFVPNGIGRTRVSLAVKGAPRYRRFGSDIALSRVDSSLALRGRTAAIEVRIDSGVLGRFEARRGSGRVALEWCDGPLSRGLTERAAAVSPGQAAPSPAGRFLHELGRSDAGAAVREIRTATKDGELHTMMGDFTRRLDTLSRAGVRENPIAMAAVMKELPKAPGPAEQAALRTLAEHRQGASIVPEAKFGPKESAEFAGAVRGAGRGDRPKANRSFSPTTDAHFTVKSSGHRLVTSMDVDPSKVKIVRGPTSKKVLEAQVKAGEVDVYVERAGILRELDFDAFPLQSLGRAAKDSRVQWVQVMDDQLSAVRPDRITLNGTELVRQPTGLSTAPTSPITAALSASRPVVILRLTTESDGDGEADDGADEEREGDDEKDRAAL